MPNLLVMPLAALCLALPLAALGQAGGPSETGEAPTQGTLPEPDQEYRQSGQFPEERRDADQDGVADIDDNCPATPAEQATPAGVLRVQVDECGCPKDPCSCDADADSVPDCRDLCPDTPIGQMVGVDGCTLPIAETRQEDLDVRFEFERDDVRPEYEPLLLRIREQLLAAPNLQVTFEGHADWKGPQQFNQPLSEGRAAACREFVLRDPRIAPTRIKTVGYGESRPIADNGTEEGRAKNRRVTAIISDVRAEPPVEAPAEPPPTPTPADAGS